MIPNEALHLWFSLEKRDFPWRKNPTPYQVWVSEVMLQQTRAAVVVPYFLRWMERFPEISSLAEASLEDVLKAWEGLGYYSRARNLHAGAREVVEKFKGRLPASYEELRSIRGIGAYTAGAILSFAFLQRAPAVDANVSRVMSRYLCIEETIEKASVQKKIQNALQASLDPKEPWVTMEALIELGALICLPNPRCSLCPLREGCLAKKEGKQEALPVKKERPKTIALERNVFLLLFEKEVLLIRGEAKKVMQDLYQFPFAEREEVSSDVEAWVKKRFDCDAVYERSFSPVFHTFTRYKAKLYPLVFSVRKKKGEGWMPIAALKELPFAGGHREIAQVLLTRNLESR